MAVNHGTRRVVVGAHYGTRDWLAQRVTAVLMMKAVTLMAPAASPCADCRSSTWPAVTGLPGRRTTPSFTLDRRPRKAPRRPSRDPAPSGRGS